MGRHLFTPLVVLRLNRLTWGTSNSSQKLLPCRAMMLLHFAGD